MDTVDRATRSRVMAQIRSRNTKPELSIRRGLHARGFRYRLHAPDLPGRPDIVLPRYRAVILVHGCFWHGHDCALFRRPKSNASYWETKANRNRQRDADVRDALAQSGWRCLTVWECALRGATKIPTETLHNAIAHWIKSSSPAAHCSGKPNTGSSTLASDAHFPTRKIAV